MTSVVFDTSSSCSSYMWHILSILIIMLNQSLGRFIILQKESKDPVTDGMILCAPPLPPMVRLACPRARSTVSQGSE